MSIEKNTDSVAYVKIGKSEYRFFVLHDPDTGEDAFFAESNSYLFKMRGNAKSGNHLKELRDVYGGESVRAI